MLDPDGLTRNQVKVIEYLAIEGLNYTEAAEKAGIGRATLYRWLRDERFSAAYDALLEEVTKRSKRRLQSQAEKAVSTIVEIAFGDHHPTKVGSGNLRLKAAQDILARGGLPAVAREERTGADGGPIENRNVNENRLDLSNLTDAQLDAFERFAASMVGGCQEGEGETKAP